MNSWGQIAVLLAWVPLVVVIHEAGHALMARPAGFRLTSFGIGKGRPLLRHRGRGGVVYYVGRWFFAGGACVAIPRGLGRGPRAALYHAGGVLAQALLALVLWALPDWWWVDPVAKFNAMVAIWNLLPWRFAGMASDGWWLVATLTLKTSAASQLFARRRVLERLVAYEEQHGSPVGIWYSRLMLAWVDLMVGKSPDGFFAEEHAVAALDPELDVLHHYVQAQWHAHHGRPLASLHLLRQASEAYGTSLTDESSDLLAVASARIWLTLGEPRAARQALAQVAGVGGVIGQEAGALLVAANVADGGLDAVESSARRLAGRSRGAFLDAPLAVRALWQAARALEHERPDAAEDLFRAARRMAARLIAGALPDDRASLVRRIGEPAGIKEPDEGAML